MAAAVYLAVALASFVCASVPTATLRTEYEPGHGKVRGELTVDGAVIPVKAKLRGRSSRAFPKKQFALKLLGGDGEKAPAALLGLPENSDFILYGPLLDSTYLRDVVTFDMARLSGRWAPRTAFVELGRANGGSPVSYEGLYVVKETIEKSSAKVWLGDGGAIYELSSRQSDAAWRAWLESQGLSDGKYGKDEAVFAVGQTNVYVDQYPKSDPPGATEHHRRLFDRLDSIIKPGWCRHPAGSLSAWWRPGLSEPCLDLREVAALVDLPSLIDYVLLQELLANPDAFVTSVFAHRRTADGPLVFGPAWDFNLAGGLGIGEDERAVDSWRLEGEEPARFSRLVQWLQVLWGDEGFRGAARSRWRELRRGAWSDAALAGVVQGHAGRIRGGAVARNQARWDPHTEWNRAIGLGGIFVRPYLGSWEAEVSALERFLVSRAAWMDENV